MVFAFSGLLLALAGFFVTHEAAKCPKCSGGLLEGGTRRSGVLNRLVTTGKPITCRFLRVRDPSQRLRLITGHFAGTRGFSSWRQLKTRRSSVIGGGP